MHLPNKLAMRPMMFSDGAKGWALQEYRNDEFGITVVKERQDRQSPFVERWTIDRLPGKAFKSFKDIKKALEAID